jgi:hypothetical protein
LRLPRPLVGRTRIWESMLSFLANIFA